MVFLNAQEERWVAINTAAELELETRIASASANADTGYWGTAYGRPGPYGKDWKGKGKSFGKSAESGKGEGGKGLTGKIVEGKSGKGKR